MKRAFAVAIALGAMLLPSAAFGQASMCGDMNNDGTVNISDLIHLVEYIFTEGAPPPMDMDSANVDECDEADICDVNYLVSYIFRGGPPPCGGSANCTVMSGGTITLDHVDGAFGSTVVTGEPITFYLRFTNDTDDNIQAFTSGFRIYSVDGATWDYTNIDTTGVLNLTQFDLRVWNEVYSPTGSGADTVAAGAVAFMQNGMTPGFDGIPFAITIGPFDAGDVGKTVCLDSSFFLEAGVWKWSVDGFSTYAPSWDGPHCFDIAEYPEAAITLDDVTGLQGVNEIPTGREITFSLRYTNNTGEDIVGIINGFRVYSPDGAQWHTTQGDTTGALTHDHFDLVYIIDHFGITGTDSDTVGLSGAAMFGDGMIDGFDDVPHTITIGPIDSMYEGRTICVDSSNFPANWTWSWQTPTNPYEPAWDGPHCFTVYFDPEPPDSLAVTPDTLEFVGWEDGPNPASQNFNVAATSGGAIAYESAVITSSGFATLTNPNGITPGQVLINVDITGRSPGSYEETVEITSVEAANSPQYVIVALLVTEEPTVKDSLVITSTTVDAGGLVQPVATKLTQPIKGATIPIEFPEGVIICSLSTAGLLTETWNYTFIQVEPDSNFASIALANSFGDVIPVGTTTVFNLYYRLINADCVDSRYIHWDTALSGDVYRSLLFADTNNFDLTVGFDPSRDSTEVLPYEPGDQDGSGVVDIADLVYMVDYMFAGGPPPPIMDAADVNHSCTGANIADLTYFVDYFFLAGPAPLCGCLDPGGSVGKVNSGIVVGASYDGSVTTISINSPIDLRGVQLELNSAGQTAPLNLVGDRLDVVHGYREGVLKVGLLDLDGGEIIAAGINRLIQVDGECELISAMVSDRRHTAWVATIGVAGKDGQLPSTFALYQNYPNPFNPRTEISFSLPEKSAVKLDIYNVMGQRVATLIDEDLDAGHHTVAWGGRSSDGRTVSSGVYFYCLKTGEFTETRKMLLLK